VKYALSHGTGISRGKHLALQIFEAGPGNKMIASTLIFIGGMTSIVF